MAKFTSASQDAESRKRAILVAIAEEKIAEMEKQREPFKEEYLRVEAELKAIQEKFDGIRGTYEQYDTEIESYRMMLNDYSGKKKATKTATIYVPKARKEMKAAWMEEFIQILRKEHKLMSFEELWKKLGSNKTFVSMLASTSLPFEKNRSAVAGNIVNFCKYERKSGRQPMFHDLKLNRFGLTEWSETPQIGKAF